MGTLTCKLPASLEGRLSALAKRRGVPKSVLVREALEEKVDREREGGKIKPANFFEALGSRAGSITGKSDLSTNKEYLKGYGR